jgi:hypothetical protein
MPPHKVDDLKAMLKFMDEVDVQYYATLLKPQASLTSGSFSASNLTNSHHHGDAGENIEHRISGKMKRPKPTSEYNEWDNSKHRKKARRCSDVEKKNSSTEGNSIQVEQRMEKAREGTDIPFSC